MDLYLTGVALVVGGGQGIGKATALSFAEAGVKALVLAGRTLETLQNTAEEAKALASNPDFQTLAVPTDITIESQVQHLISEAVEKFGRLDYCVNVSGSLGPARVPFVQTTTENWDATQAVNSDGMFYLLREQIKVMQTQERVTTPQTSQRRPGQRGAIVVCGSAAAQVVLPGAGSYVASKSACQGMAKSAAHDHAAEGIRINIIMPGYVLTPGLMSFPGTGPERVKKLYQSIPMGRMGEPGEIGDMAVMMCSPRNSYMVGAGVLVDGGSLLSAE